MKIPQLLDLEFIFSMTKLLEFLSSKKQHLQTTLFLFRQSLRLNMLIKPHIKNQV